MKPLNTLEESRNVPVRVIAMLWLPGYFAEFWRVVQDRDCTHKDGWLHCEAELTRYGMPGKFDSYESFRVGKHRQSLRGKDKPDSLPLVGLW